MQTIIIHLFLLLLFYQNLNSQDTPTGLSADSIEVVLDSTSSFYDTHNYEGMAAYLEEHIDQIHDQDSLKMWMYYRMTIAYGHIEEYDKQFDCILNGLKIGEQLNDDWILMSLYRELGAFYFYNLEDQSTGIKHMRRAVQHMRDDFRADNRIGLMMEMAQLYTYAEMMDSAAVYYRKSFDYLPEYPQMKYDVYSFYTPYLLETEQYDSAEYYLLLSYDGWKEKGYKRGLASTCVELADIYSDRKQYDKAEQYINEALVLSNETNSIYRLLSSTELKAEISEKQGRSDESLQYYKKLNALKDSLTAMKSDQQLSQKQIELIQTNHAEQIAEVESLNANLTSKSSSLRYGMWGALGLLTVGSLIFILADYRKKKRIKDLNQAMEQTKEQKKTLQDEYMRAIEELERNKRELTSNALFLEKKNETLKSVRRMLSDVEGTTGGDVSDAIKSARKLADSSINIDSNWESFRYFFEQVYPSFYDSIKGRHTDLSRNELRCLSYMRIGLTDKESARLLGINTTSFQKAKYRIKKKLDLPKETSVEDYIEQYK